MRIHNSVPMIATDKLEQAKAFYVSHFGFRTTFESEGHLCLRSPGEDGSEIMFSRPDGEHMPAFEGKGLTWCLEVKDVDAEHERLQSAGVPVVRPLQDNPWGDRSFVVVDPAGVPLWIFKCIKPTAEFEHCFKE